MAGPITSSESAPAVIQFGYESGGQIFPLTTSGFLAEVVYGTIEESLNMPASGIFILKSKSSDYVDRLLKTIMFNDTPRIKIRLGIASKASAKWLPWQTHSVVHYTAKPTGIGTQGGHQITLQTSDILRDLTSPEKVASHRGTISKIVAKMMASYGIPVLIEPTAGDGLYIQSYMTDFDFLLYRLLPRALSGKGRGNFRFYMKDGTFHFHSPDYHSEVKTYDVFKSENSTSELSELDNTQLADEQFGVHKTVYDPYTGQTQIIKPFPGLALRYANSMPNQIGAIPGKNLSGHLALNPVSEEVAMIQNAYEAVRALNYQLQLLVEKAPWLRLNDLLNVQVAQEKTKSSPWSGYYSVTGVKHTYDSGTLSSCFILSRGEMQAGAGNFKSLKDLGVNVVEKSFTAPGKDLNLAEIVASSVIRGSGDRRIKSVTPA